jgi:hypothetical protein
MSRKRARAIAALPKFVRRLAPVAYADVQPFAGRMAVELAAGFVLVRAVLASTTSHGR